MRREGVVAWIVTCAMIGGSVHQVARAQTPTAEQLEAGRAAFKEGLLLEKDGKYEEALEKFELTAKVKSTPQVRFHIALCNEKLGHWTAAIEAYEAAAKQADAEGSAPEVSKVAPDLAKRLREKMPRLTVAYAAGLQAESLVIDGKTIEGAKASALPLDPGRHVVIATKGEAKKREEVELKEGDDKTVTLDLGHPSAVSKLDEDHPAEHVKDEKPQTPKSSGSSTTTIGWVLTGVGVAALGTSFAFYGLRASKMRDLEASCIQGKCPPSVGSTIDGAKTFTTLGHVTLGVGIAALGTGIVLLVTGKPSEPEPTKSARLVPWSPGSQLGFGIEGAF